MRGAALLIGVLGLIGLTGCATKSAATVSARGATACLPNTLSLSGPRPVSPRELTTPLEAMLVSKFALFRRPMVPGDVPSRADLGSSTLGLYLSRTYNLASFYPAYVRLIGGLPHGRRYYAVPAVARTEVVSTHCAPAAVRRDEEQQPNRLTEPVYCVIETGSTASAGAPGCEAFVQVGESFSAFRVSDLAGQPAVELVPDGVASVRVRYTGVAPIVLPVRENAFVLIPPPAPQDRLTAHLRGLLPRVLGEHVTRARQLTAKRQWDAAFAGTYPTRIEWLNSAGRVVRAVSRPVDSTSTLVGDLHAPIKG